MRIVFLLGAGCECKSTSYDMTGGTDFKKDTIRCRQASDLFDLINRHDVYQLDRQSVVKHNSTSILYQTLKENQDFYEKVIRDPDYGEYVTDYMNHKKGIENKEKYEQLNCTVSNKFYDYFRNCYYEPLVKEESDDRDKSETPLQETPTEKFRRDIFDEFMTKAAFYSYVDSLFNYLRYPSDYKKEVQRVMKLYFSAYYSIIKKSEIMDQVIARIGNKDILQNRKWLDETVKQWFDEKSEEAVRSKDTKHNYYLMLKELCDSQVVRPFFVTTNYTPFLQNTLQLHKEEISYLHGRIDLFENLETKKIGRLTEFNEKDIVFPFLFVQSGIKPIVSLTQMNEYNKLYSVLKDPDCQFIFILGYGVNSDDEHITNMLRECVCDEGEGEKVVGNKIIADFVYRPKKDEISRLKKLLPSDSVLYLDASDFYEVCQRISQQNKDDMLKQNIFNILKEKEIQGE